MKKNVLSLFLSAMKYLLLFSMLLTISMSLVFASSSKAQEVKSVREVYLIIGFNNQNLESVFSEIESKTPYYFGYERKNIDSKATINLPKKRMSVADLLIQIARQTPLRFRQVNNNIDVIPLNQVQDEPIEVIIEQTVTGVVKDENGEQLPGVSVQIKGTNKGTITDIDGSYSIQVPDNESTLVFSFVGMETIEMTVGDQNIINVTLKMDVQSLNEVVVVGYGIQRKSSVVGAIDQVNADKLEGRPNANMTQALQGVAPNLIIQQPNSEPGARMNINIRGISTLGDNSPLIVIDGIVGGDLNLINPSDIASVSVLKDAGSAAIYGSRANNGVIVVTTKKGQKNKGMTITYNGLMGVNNPHYFMKPVSGYQNAILRNESAANAGKTSVVYTPEQIRQFKENGDEEWFAEEIVKPAWQQNHNLSLSGGNEQSTYFLSLGYLDQESNFVGPDKGLKRYNFRMNMTNDLGRFKLTSMLNYVRRETTDHSSSTGTLIVDASRVPLIYAQRDSLGRFLTNDVLQEFNSLGILEEGGFRKYDDDNVFGNLQAEFEILDGLSIKGVFGGALYSNHQFARTKQVNFFPKGLYGANRNTYDESRKSIDLNTQLILQYMKNFAQNHNLNLLVGASNENHTDRGTGIYKTLTDPDLGTPTTETIVSPDSYTSNQSSSENSLNSLFGRVSYDFSNKYFAEFSFRYDGSSKFNEDNRWGFFPSASVGYRVTQEDFMKGYLDRVGGIKLRASYGVLGNQNVGNYQYQTTYFTFPNAYGFNDSGVGGTGYNFANPNLKWERAATLNIGADMDFIDGNLTLSLDYFNKVTSNILVPPAVPGVFGTGLPDFNAGKVANRGWEIALSYVHKTGQMTHTFSGNLGDSQNEVLDFQGNERLQGKEELQILLREGYPYNSYVGLKHDGYFQNMEDVQNSAKPEGLTNLFPGDNKYVDINEDGKIDDDDLVVFGSPFPRLTYGLTYSVQFNGFDLNIFLQGVGKRTMMLRGELVEPFHFNYGMTMYEHQLDYWTPQNTDAAFPRLADNGSQSNTNNYRRGSDLYLFNAAYLRVKNIQLGYTVPANMASKIGAKKIRAYVSGQNLFTFSKLKFVDPELSEFDGSLRSGGANSGRAYPTMIYYGFGLDITF
ncbi:SusC/RagA family TonB-linked outer membrane protein [Fulvivirga ligni]|uniref:SusC/RagA family TonB-linked outer membrane protein n=1 Tax=Fulvivirga ligni TaxID=2904246 RepID=UPI001F4380B4|nr:TonB-dependent receptor [Fulvivirga ligni]UII19982.1 TonB-dependent receptor [Fulvivirga ligni]